MPHHKRRGPRGGAGLVRTGKADEGEAWPFLSWSASYFNVHDGRRCRDHVLVGHRSFRAFDAEEGELGVYASCDEARAAVVAAGRIAPG